MSQGSSASGSINVTGNNNVVAMQGGNININTSEVLLYELLEQSKRLNANIEKQSVILETLTH